MPLKYLEDEDIFEQNNWVKHQWADYTNSIRFPNALFSTNFLKFGYFQGSAAFGQMINSVVSDLLVVCQTQGEQLSAILSYFNQHGVSNSKTASQCLNLANHTTHAETKLSNLGIVLLPALVNYCPASSSNSSSSSVAKQSNNTDQREVNVLHVGEIQGAQRRMQQRSQRGIGQLAALVQQVDHFEGQLVRKAQMSEPSKVPDDCVKAHLQQRRKIARHNTPCWPHWLAAPLNSTLITAWSFACLLPAAPLCSHSTRNRLLSTSCCCCCCALPVLVAVVVIVVVGRETKRTEREERTGRRGALALRRSGNWSATNKKKKCEKWRSEMMKRGQKEGVSCVTNCYCCCVSLSLLCVFRNMKCVLRHCSNTWVWEEGSEGAPRDVLYYQCLFKNLL